MLFTGVTDQPYDLSHAGSPPAQGQLAGKTAFDQAEAPASSCLRSA